MAKTFRKLYISQSKELHITAAVASWLHFHNTVDLGDKPNVGKESNCSWQNHIKENEASSVLDPITWKHNYTYHCPKRTHFKLVFKFIKATFTSGK